MAGLLIRLAVLNFVALATVDLGAAIVARSSTFHHFQQPDRVGVLQQGTSSHHQSGLPGFSPDIAPDTNTGVPEQLSFPHQTGAAAADGNPHIRSNELLRVSGGQQNGDTKWPNSELNQPSATTDGANAAAETKTDRASVLRQGFSYSYGPVYSSYSSPFAGFRHIGSNYPRQPLSVNYGQYGYNSPRYSGLYVSNYGPRLSYSAPRPYQSSGFPVQYLQPYYGQQRGQSISSQYNRLPFYRPPTNYTANYFNAAPQYSSYPTYSTVAQYNNRQQYLYQENNQYEATTAPSVDTSIYECPPLIADFCVNKEAGHYSHPDHYAQRCFVQCDQYGEPFVRTCAGSTLWRSSGPEPALGNMCA